MITTTDEIQVTDEAADTAAEILMKSKWSLQMCKKWGQLHNPFTDFTKKTRLIRSNTFECKSCGQTVAESDMRKANALWEVFEEITGIKDIIADCNDGEYRVFLLSQYLSDTEILIANQRRLNQDPGAIDVARLVQKDGSWELDVKRVEDDRQSSQGDTE